MNEHKTYRGLAWIAAVAFFMQTLDATILNTALPAISRSLHESPLEMQLAIISYALSVALFIPLSGWLADKHGTLKIFRLAIGIFVLGSIACACANSLNTLVVARVIQGFGGALMMPVARLAIIRNVPKLELLNAWNTMAMAGLIGPILGPILGGWLVTYATWHWIFLINIPIGLLGMFIAGLYMPNSKGVARKLDWIGFILFAGGLVGLTLGLDLIAENVTPNDIAFLIFIVGIIFLALYYVYARRCAQPLLPLSLFHIRTFRIGFIANLFIRLCGSGIPFLLPLMFQIIFGYGADLAGWLMAPIALSSVIVKTFIGKVLNKLGYKKTLLTASFGMSLVIALMSLLHKDTPIWQIIPLLMAYGACMSMIFTSVNTLTVSDLSDQLASAGSTMLSVIQQVGIGVGIAVSSVLLGLYRSAQGDSGERLQQAFSYTFLTSTIFGVILLLVLSRLHARDGEHLQHRKEA
ncbi:DHA2 family efflux MFS transporter permease subunit [Caviibacterium pharyngocola]|uniref:MFS transporter n=1 Tax=Caviibacterium pharyngocola TaxID=28159 RepID=A0A2M8RTH2_9PAST|nr:DHA2 family efflux MFS transporter permease subunit [Caviibacterium pharyngocola]PJG82187.1 MFS transporter [Caviibacterium pharyngocola]